MEEQGKAGELLKCPACETQEGEALVVEHSAFEGEMRMACDCGMCGPWEIGFENCYESWNRVAALRASHERMREQCEIDQNRADSAEAEACDLAGQVVTLRAEHERMREEVARLRKGVAAVEVLIDQSSGVDGLHLNGDLAPWDELRTGGRYEEWLLDLDAALSPPAPGGGGA